MASFETLDFQVIRDFVQAPHTVDILLAFAGGNVNAIVFQEITDKEGTFASPSMTNQMQILPYYVCFLYPI